MPQQPQQTQDSQQPSKELSQIQREIILFSEPEAFEGLLIKGEQRGEDQKNYMMDLSVVGGDALEILLGVVVGGCISPDYSDRIKKISILFGYLDLNTPDASGRTPLSIVADAARTHGASSLREVFDLINKNDATHLALDLALKGAYTELAKLFHEDKDVDLAGSEGSH